MGTPNSISGKMTINLPGVIKTLGEALYSDPSVSVRELIQNANDACVVRQVEDSNAPNSEIHIRFDKWNRHLVVVDNGAGMTKEQVSQSLTVIGSSRTEEVRSHLESIGQDDIARKLIGRFGLGLLSAFIIGDHVEFVTLSHEEGAEPILWECDGGQEYSIGIPKGEVSVGTTVTIHVNPKHVGMLQDDELTRLIHLYADFLEVPIYLDPLPNPVNVMSAPWDRDASEMEYRQFVTERFPREALLAVIPLEINEDGGKFQVGGVLYIPKQPSFIIKEYGMVTAYVRRMYVRDDERELLPSWAKFVKGIVSSPNLRETTSRESIIRDENFERVQRILSKTLLAYLSRVSTEDSKLFREIVTNHNVVIKAWAIESKDLFDQIKDIVLFQTDAGMLNLQRYFELSRFSKGSRLSDGMKNQVEDNRYIFYSTTPGGAGTSGVLFAHKGIRVIDASQFPDESFLRIYAERHDNVEIRRLDVSGSYIFEELEKREYKWIEMEDVFAEHRIDAKVVRFAPVDIPAVLIYPEAEPVTDQVDRLLADPNLSPSLRSLVGQMWENREKDRKGRIGGSGVLYVNANNPIIEKLADLGLHDQENQEILVVIYNNALLLSTQGAKLYLTPENAKKVFDSFNKTVGTLMTKIYEVHELSTRQIKGFAEQLAETKPSSGSALTDTPSPKNVEQTAHVMCFVALPFRAEYDIVIEALRDVLETHPYFWEVARADKRHFANTVDDNVGQWIARAHCYVVDISEGNDNVMMELGQMYWGYPERPLLILQREGMERDLADLGKRLYISYPWGESPNRESIAAKFRSEISKYDEIKKLRSDTNYLSTRVMNADFIQPKVAQAIADKFLSIEDFLSKDPAEVSKIIGSSLGRTGVIQEIQEFVREQIKK